MSQLKPFFSYYGGKYKIGKHYPKPKYEYIVEPFAGSAGYSLHYAGRNVHLYDKNPEICAVWDYLIRVGSSEIMSLPVDVDRLESIPVEEARVLVGYWFARASTYSRPVCSPWSKQHPSWGWSERVRERIAKQVEHIRHWKITCGSFESIKNFRATWFVDPPYMDKAGRKYTYNELNYDVLSLWVRGRYGQQIVCETDGATWLPFKDLVVAHGATKKYNEKIYYGEL